MSKSAWIHIIFGNACSTQGLWLDKIGGSENFLIFIPYLGPLVHSERVLKTGLGVIEFLRVTASVDQETLEDMARKLNIPDKKFKSLFV